MHFWNSVPNHPCANLEDELYHFSVDQSVHRLPVDVCDEVTSTQASLLGGAAVLNVLPSAIQGRHEIQRQLRSLCLCAVNLD